MTALPLADPPAQKPRWLGLPLLSAIQRDPLGAASCFQQDLGDVAKLSILFRRIYYLFCPKLARAVLVDHHGDLRREARLLKLFQTVQGRNVLTSEGPDWERQRRIVAPAFSSKKMPGYMDLMDAAINAGVNRELPAQAGASAVVDVDCLTTRITMDVILRTLFSKAANRDEADRISAAVRGLSQQTMREAYWPIVARSWMPLPGNAAKRRHTATLRQLIDAHLRARSNSPGEASEHDVLGMLLAARDDQPNADRPKLTPLEIRDNCNLLFGAGFDTSSSALTWWIGLMALHPDAVARIRAELQASPDSNSQTIARLPYLNATLKEAMRLYPPSSALITRVAQRTLRVGDLAIPKNTLIVVPIWHLHRDPRSFPEPLEFRPERFLPGAPSFPRGAYMPFGAGPHVCLGQQFATIEMALIAARLVTEFDWTFDDGHNMPECFVDLVLKPKTRMLVEFRRRETP